jgi:hypothetical protein
MKTIYLHIGTFKTGTSSIQKFLKDNTAFLKTKGYIVPHTVQVGHHKLPLSLLQAHTDYKIALRQFGDRYSEIWEETLKEIESSPLEKVIISSEIFCDFAHESIRKDSEKLKKILKKHFKNYDVKVICYVRPILPYSLSFYKEQIKIGRSDKRYADVMDEFLNHRSIHLFPSNYLDFFADVFGKENMIVKTYERKCLLNQSSVDDFLSVIGISDLSDIPRNETIEANLSIPNELIDLKRAFNFAEMKDKKLNRIISNKLIETNRKNVSNEKIKFSNEEVQNEYSIALDGIFTLPEPYEQYTSFELFENILQSITSKQNSEIKKRLKTLHKRPFLILLKKFLKILKSAPVVLIKANSNSILKQNIRLGRVKEAVEQENKKLYDEYGLELKNEFDFPDMHNSNSVYELFQVALQAMIVKQNIKLMYDLNIIKNQHIMK